MPLTVPMKRIPKSSVDACSVLVLGAHPDDIEFGCGGVVARETQSGRTVHLVVCSRGEAATRGTPKQRVAEARRSAALLGASLEWLEFDGDAHLELKVAHAIAIATIIRRRRPEMVLAPSPVANQHPDHSRLGHLVRDAARLARYGGVQELRRWPPHSIGQLFFYALTPESEPPDISPLLVDVSAPAVLAAWTEAMNAHASQAGTRSYAELQLQRAQLNGQRAGIGYAIPVFPNDAPVLESLAVLRRGARHF